MLCLPVDDARAAQIVSNLCKRATAAPHMRVATVHTDVKTAIPYLVRGDPANARTSTVIEKYPSRCKLFLVVTHHGLPGRRSRYIRCGLARVERYLRDSRTQTTYILSSCTAERWQLVPFIARDINLHGCLKSLIVVPQWTPTSPHRLSDDGAVNAWLWLIKGDGDVTERGWKAMVAAEVLVDIVAMIAELHKSGSTIFHLRILCRIAAWIPSLCSCSK
jgi:hypothetical protein